MRENSARLCRDLADWRFRPRAGALLLINRYVPLALTILGPAIVNILLYHLLLNHEAGVR